MADASRLPATIRPTRYELTLVPDLVAHTFSGSVRIEVTVDEEAAAVVLNAIELDITGATIDGGAATIALDDVAEQATFTPASAVAAGPHIVEATFTGILNDKLHGFYRSTFADPDGTEHTIATTQFEATDARRAFPCFDEPAFKASFAVTLVVPSHLAAISNAAEVSTSDNGDGTRTVAFAETMVMSTYLVAFVVGALVATDVVDVDGVPLRVIAPAHRINLAPFALEAGAHCLREFTKFFGIPYPGDKLDLVAIPDFAFGAMENLGCVTFRETALLVDPATASQADLQRVADVVHHEIAHMWFGDLVTMGWWEGIWLNEAFATFMELKATDTFRPAWQRWTSFGVERAAAFGVDALVATRPIEFPVISPAEAEGMFDVLTYQKGCAVMRMCERWLGDDVFRDGLRLYMQRHAYANTVTSDLWQALEDASGQPVRAVMNSWILQGGHPVVSCSLSSGGSSLTLSQERFLLAGGDVDAAELDRTWQVPVRVRASVAGKIVERVLLLDAAGATVDLGGRAEWVVANAGAEGFFRTRYGASLLAALIGAGEAAALTALERFTLASDTWALVLGGLAPIADFVQVARFLATTGEPDPDVWSALASGLGMLDRIAGPEDRDAVAGFVRSIAAPVFAKLGWEAIDGESDRTAALRGTLAALLGGAGADKDVRDRCADLLDAYLADRSAVPPDLVAAVVGVSARNADAATYDKLLARYQTPTTPQEETRFLMALAQVGDVALLARTLDLAVNSVRSQNAPYLIAQALANRAGGRAAWAFVHEHFAELGEKFPSNSIARMLGGLAAQADPALAADARAFLSEHPVPQGAKQVEQTLEAMAVNAAFSESAAAHLAAALG